MDSRNFQKENNDLTLAISKTKCNIQLQKQRKQPLMRMNESNLSGKKQNHATKGNR